MGRLIRQPAVLEHRLETHKRLLILPHLLIADSHLAINKNELLEVTRIVSDVSAHFESKDGVFELPELDISVGHDPINRSDQIQLLGITAAPDHRVEGLDESPLVT